MSATDRRRLPAPRLRHGRLPALGLLVAFAGAGIAALTGAPAQAQAGGDAAAAGRQKAQACTVCHGPLGVSSAPDAPNLAAQPAIYLAAQLRAYRSGERRHEVMSVMSKTLTDQDIDNLAAWYASLQIDVRQP